MNKVSVRQKIIKKCDKLLSQIILLERGSMCEICGKRSNLGAFHILNKGTYPRIRFNKANILIAGWYCCHHPYHHNYYTARDRIIPKIKELRGDDYEDELRKLDAIAPKHNTLYLELLHEALKIELEALNAK